MGPYITSILDTDLYKLTMQQAVLQHYPDAQVAYRFTNRGKTPFSRAAFNDIKASIAHLATLSLTPKEHAWLEKRCSFFTPSYLAFLASFRFNPEAQVTLTFVPEDTDQAEGDERGSLRIELKGLWSEVIPYEVPIMSIVSEAYFKHDNTSWGYTGQIALAKQKGKELFTAGCVVSEFGSRRRRSYLAQDLVMQGLVAANAEFGTREGKLAGTSNVHFAEKFDVAPIGTIAHEWIMGIAAIEGYQGSNGRAMDLWDATYPSGALSIALTDTFSTKPFFDDFLADPVRARKWKGLRQDSGDPAKFIPLAKEVFEKVGADPRAKVIVFSDALDVARCIKLKQLCVEAGVGCSFGVGTHFTNDYKIVANPVKQAEPGSGPIREGGEQSKALNMVIKLYKINGDYCVKISDELNKNTGNPEALRQVKERFGLETDSPTDSP